MIVHFLLDHFQWSDLTRLRAPACLVCFQEVKGVPLHDEETGLSPIRQSVAKLSRKRGNKGKFARFLIKKLAHKSPASVSSGGRYAHHA